MEDLLVSELGQPAQTGIPQTGFDNPYEPGAREAQRAQYWVDKGFFESNVDDTRPAYTIVIPPPNVTGDLHIGHVLNNTLQDVLIRWQRLKGKNVCWIPGTDHASIATEAKVTELLSKQGVSKRELGRAGFLQEAFRWKEKYSGRIAQNLKRMGASCAWSREVFTMDPVYSRAVLSAFVELYNKGLVYKGARLVNWCPASQSVISDEEVNSEERQGSLWHIAYPLCDAQGNVTAESLVVATTRPETLFGDLALAVHPSDERYSGFVGKQVKIPGCGRLIPVIADHYVEREFGTGVVKITPAHDMNDFEVGARHHLGLLNIMNPDASLNDNVPQAYRGLDRYVARKKLVTELKEMGALVKTENHKMVVGISERGNVPIEYYLSEQWYFKMADMAKLALDATRTGELSLYPRFTEKIWDHWLENIKDWCVSRQLWWGHRIPIYTCSACGELDCQVEAPTKCKKCGHTELKQDEDVLDTWASSWLWPFGVHGWPARDAASANALKRYYPTELIITGQDIIFFWIARMVMAGKFLTGQMPFHSVYFTPIVRDEKGRKMSKSLGNSPDIGEVMQTYGTDALRFALVNQIVLGQDIHWKNESCDMGRHFSNKLWNAARFLVSHVQRLGLDLGSCSYENLEIPEDDLARWLLSEYNNTVARTDEALSSYQFAHYSAQLYEFFWMVYCDWFVELLKPRVTQEDSGQSSGDQVKILRFAMGIFDGALRLLHPVMPFVTEEIWQRLGSKPNDRDGKTIGLLPWPDASLARYATDFASIAQMRRIQDVVSAIRAIRGHYGIHPAEVLTVHLPQSSRSTLQARLSQLEFLGRCKIEFGGRLGRVVGASLASGIKVFVDLSAFVDPAQERVKLDGRIAKLQAVIAGIDKKLTSDSFVKGAPAEIVAGARAQRDQNDAECRLLCLARDVIAEGGASFPEDDARRGEHG
jgi:valyl-tRNA synthetase